MVAYYFTMEARKWDRAFTQKWYVTRGVIFHPSYPESQDFIIGLIWELARRHASTI